MRGHERLHAALGKMSMEQIVEAYRRARRAFEAKQWGDGGAVEEEIRSEILARAIADRVAFGSVELNKEAGRD